MLKRLIAALEGRKFGLRSKGIGERPFHVVKNDKTQKLYHSSFNTDWFAELGVAPKIIVDLGSYDGGDAYRFKKAFPAAKVITVEADPIRFGIAKDNLSGEDIQVLNYAACSIDGKIDWYAATVDGETDAQGSIYRHTEAYQKRFSSVEQAKVPSKVPGKRFDSLAHELGVTEIDLLHMDIEGAEHTVLKTLGNIRPRMIYLEWREGAFQGESCGPETEVLLKSMNYRLVVRKTLDRLYFLPRV